MRMYERETAAAAVQRLLDAASEGRGGTLFVIGSAGLGKSTVLEAAVASAQGRFAVRRGAGDAVETALPYGLIGQALGDELEVLAPFLDAQDVPAATRFYVTLRHVRRETAQRPLLLAFDDLHWADPDSLTLLHLLCRRAPGLPLAVVVTARPWPDAPLQAAEQLAAQGMAVIHQLAPLTDRAARRVLRDRLGVISHDAAGWAVAACEGNPLLLELMTPGLAADRTGAPAAEATLRMRLARWAGVDATANRFVRAATVLGTRFRPSVATAVADLTDTETAHTIEGLLRADLLRSDDDGWARFRHALVRQVIYEDISPPVRAYLHERAFRALLRAGVPTSEAAEHAIAAGLFGDAQAIEALTAAGRTALRAGAVQAARRYLDAAGSLAGDNAPPVLQLDLARALLASGAEDAAVTLLDNCILVRSDLPGSVRTSAQLLLGQAAFQSGAVERAANLFEVVAGTGGGSDPGLALDALLGHTLQIWARLGPRAALPVAIRARSLAAGASRYQKACAEAAWGMCATLLGDVAALRAVEAVARGFAHPAFITEMAHWAFDPAAALADIMVCAEQFDVAERLLADALRVAETRAEPFLLFHAAMSSSEMLRRLGRLDEAIAMAERACDLGDLVPVALPLARAAKGLALMEAGRLAEADACYDPGTGTEWYLAAALQLKLHGMVAYRQGHIDTACSAFDLLDHQMSELGIADPSHVQYSPEAIASYLAAGRLEDAQRAVGRLTNCPLPTKWPAAMAAAGESAIAAHKGDLETAESNLALATSLIHDTGMPLAQCQTLTAYGAVLARAGQREKARRLLGTALQQAQACGSDWHADQAMAELRRAGGRTHRIPTDQLSPQEKAVARLARAGRTNQEIGRELFLSVNTVETHLSHVYRKLGIRRRSQLTSQDLN